MSDLATLLRQQTALADLAGSAPFQSFDLDGCLRAVAETGAEGLECARCSVWVRRLVPASLACLALYDEESGGHSPGPVLSQAEHPSFFRLLDQPRPQIFLGGDAALPPEIAAFMAGHRFTALMQHPVVVDGRLTAVLAFADRRAGRCWSDEDQLFARALAGFVGMAFQGDGLRHQDRPGTMVSPPASFCAPCRPATPSDQMHTVLLVDGDSVVHDLLGEALDQERDRLIHAFDAEQGFALAADLQPNVLVLNVLSPELDGWGLLARLKSDPRTQHLPVLMLTMTDEAETGFVLRASDYLTKPFRFEGLLETVAAHHPAEGQGRALVVEDEATTRSILARLLERDGWLVETAASGYEGLHRIERRRPDVVLLDLMMPGMDGFSFIRLLRLTEPPGPPLPVVVITAKDLSDEERAWLSGVTEAMARDETVPRSEMVQTVRDWVRRATARSTIVL